MDRSTGEPGTAAAPAVAGQTQDPASRSGGDRNWSARIRASIARLMEIDGISLDPENYARAAEKRKARMAEQAFRAKVDQLEAASETAHKEYWDRLRDVYSASTVKKMRLTPTSSPPPTATASSEVGAAAAAAASSLSWHHEALDTLAVAAATEQFNEPEAPIEPAATKTKKTKRSSRRPNPLPLEGEAGTERNLVQVHDPALAKAIDKLTSKLTQLLGQLQATSDAAMAESILAAAATIALEATEMRRCEEVALTRMVEIEEHRQQIMQGLQEYAKRKEKREMDEGSKEGAQSASDSRDSSPPPQDTDSKAD
ncbi:unnamed protein product [Phytophthora lilii]|uniref:Unnamed protein product n=1 Tax=Phytophthora lilii TaxID=2077276 RepID=A0A9W6WMY7_9STRA|nr:unnamed protein product [Phytophthora lilii]